MATRGKGHKGTAHRKPTQGTANRTRPINTTSKGIAPSASSKPTTAAKPAAKQPPSAPATASSAPRKISTAVLEAPSAPSAVRATTKPTPSAAGTAKINGTATRRAAVKQPGYRSRMNQRKHMRQQQVRILGTVAAVLVVAGLAWLLISHLPSRTTGANSKAAKPAATAHVTANATIGATAVAPTATQVVCATQKIPGLNGTPTTDSGPPAISGTLATGDQCLQYVDVKPGSGPAVKAGDNVTVNYTGWLSTGQKFDSSLNPGRTPFQVQNVGQASVIQGWNLGLIGMKAGGERRLVIPYQLGYGAGGSPPSIPGYATLIFDITVISVN